MSRPTRPTCKTRNWPVYNDGLNGDIQAEGVDELIYGRHSNVLG